jgi:ATP-binding cassette subfamily C protein
MWGLLAWDDRLRWGGIAGFAMVTSLFEMLTASVVVVFGQVLTNPSVGVEYLGRLGVHDVPAHGQVIITFAILCGLVYLVKNIIAGCEVFFQSFNIQSMNYHFKNKLLGRYAHFDYATFLTRNSSYGLTVVGTDSEVTFSTAMVAFATILSEFIIFSCLIGFIIYMNPPLALVIFSLGAVITVVVGKVLMPQFYQWGKRAQDAAMMCWQNLMQFFHAHKDIVLMGKESFFIDAYKHHSYTKSRIQSVQTATNVLPRLVIEVLFIGLFVVAVSFLASRDADVTGMIGVLAGYMYAGFRLMPGLNRIIAQLNILKSATPSVDRVYEEFITQPAEGDYKDIPSFHFNNDLRFESVAYSYPQTERAALQGVDLVIAKGECVGIVGQTGSGKSTLIDLMLGLLKPASGRVVVDDEFPVSSRQWHQCIGYVPQAIYLIDDTIAANIAFGVKASDIDYARMNKAIDDAQLRALLDKLPEGVNTTVGERGVRLSGGERQRIAIARALYRNPQVLIFDEATSALDHDTEEKLMETIHAVSRDHTVIMIAHRISTLAKCSRIYKMDNGHLAGAVSYQELKQA